MYVGIAKITLALSDSHSLKAKRMVLRRARDRLRERLGVAIHEVGAQDIWQRAELGCAVVSGERGKVAAVLDDALRIVQAAIDGEAAIVGLAKTIETFSAASQPYAGKPADAGADNWMPDEWRDELDAEAKP